MFDLEKFKKFFSGIIYVDPEPEEEETEKKEAEEIKETLSAVRETIKEETVSEPVQEPVIEQVKPETPVISKPVSSSFITLEKSEPAPVKKEEELPKVKSVFRQVEIVSPLGPSSKRTDGNSYSHVRAEKKEEKEYKPVVKVISIFGPDGSENSNDDIDEDVANMTIDDFITNTKTEYLDESIKVQPEISQYTKQLEDVFHQEDDFDDIISEVTENRKEETKNIDFSIPTHLKTKQEQNDALQEELEDNFTLFDFLEDK